MPAARNADLKSAVHMITVIDNPDAYYQCVETLRNGGIICYPTETFYALGVDPWNQSACEKLYQLKKRPAEKEMPLIASSAEMVAQYCDTSDSRFAILAKKFWPGPLTIVLPSKDYSGTCAIRVSSNISARLISEIFGKPVISTSANISGTEPLRKPEDLSEQLSEGIDVVLNGGICPGGLPSTIISLLNPEAQILREGAIPSKEILSIL
jgi:L-threonylcarbamoyladenylate synthase